MEIARPSERLMFQTAYVLYICCMISNRYFTSFKPFFGLSPSLFLPACSARTSAFSPAFCASAGCGGRACGFLPFPALPLQSPCPRRLAGEKADYMPDRNPHFMRHAAEAGGKLHPFVIDNQIVAGGGADVEHDFIIATYCIGTRVVVYPSNDMRCLVVIHTHHSYSARSKYGLVLLLILFIPFRRPRYLIRPAYTGG